MKDQNTKEKFIELRAQGISFEKIAKELKVSKQTLINWSKELALEISNMKALKLDELQEMYSLSKQKRIELLGKKLQTLEEELDNRDLETIPTHKLFELLLKYQDVLKDEDLEIVFKKKQGLEDNFLADMVPIDTWKT